MSLCVRVSEYLCVYTHRHIGTRLCKHVPLCVCVHVYVSREAVLAIGCSPLGYS